MTREKLVRDGIIEHIRAKGEAVPPHRTVPRGAEHFRLMREKLVEEAIEFRDDPSPKEAADFVQVLLDMHECGYINDAVVSLVAHEKHKLLGGFTGGVVATFEMASRHPTQRCGLCDHRDLTADASTVICKLDGIARLSTTACDTKAPLVHRRWAFSTVGTLCGRFGNDDKTDAVGAAVTCPICLPLMRLDRGAQPYDALGDHPSETSK